jgi:CheY-like chemotaxis protein
MLDGSIGVESTAGEGSTFWFTVTLGRQLRGGTLPPHAQAELLRGRRALVVDDNATNRKIVQHYIAACGMLADVVVSGPAALDALKNAQREGRRYDIVLCDFQMPDMDGISVCRAIHRNDETSGIPMLLLTSLDRRISGTELGACGIVEMLTKPLRQRELVSAIVRAVQDSAADRASRLREMLNPAPAASANDPAGEAVSPKRSLRILVAEDNVVNQRVTMFQLRKLGHKAVLACDGLEVLEALERSEYDVILMDCQMPEMDGYEATKRIRLNKRHQAVRIVAMTANAMKGDREACLAAGMDDYVSKPTTPEDLRLALLRATGMRN